MRLYTRFHHSVLIVLMFTFAAGMTACNGALTGPTHTPAPTPTRTPISVLLPCQDSVDAVSRLLQDHVQTPEHLLKEDAVKTGDEFDANAYFAVLKHLSMPPDHVLDYVYSYEGLGGEPVLYARPASQPPYRTYSEYIAARYPGVDFVDWRERRYRFVDDVQADGTAEGFFELVVLETMGAQFYQYWHAGYNDTAIVCDRSGLEAVFAATDEFLHGRTVPLDVRQQAQTLDFTPTVTFRGDTVFVRVVTFTKWGGFIEGIYSMNRQFPHRLSVVGGKGLVPYECGIVF